MSKRRRKKGWKIKLWSIFALLCLLGGAAVFAYKGCVLKKVTVAGTDLYSEEELKQWILNDEYSWNTLYVFLKYRFVDPEEMPFLQGATVTMAGPSELHIQAKEKEILGYLYIPGIGQNAYFDKDGIVVETSSEKIDGIMEVTGLDCEKVTLNKKIPVKKDSMLRAMLNLTQGLENHEILPTVVHYDEFSNISLEYPKVTVNFGTADALKAKMEALAVIFPKVEGLEGTLHMEGWSEEHPDVPFEKNGISS